MTTVEQRVTVVIPWRPTPTRVPAYERVTAHLAPLEARGWLIRPTDTEHDPFNRAAARNAGIRAAPDGVVIVHDADILIPHRQLTDAVRDATRTGALVTPYTRVTYTDAKGRPWHITTDAPGGCAVATRTAWATLGGYDDTFTGWGYEDNALAAHAARTIGRAHIPGDAVHLWHDPDPRDERTDANRLRWLEAAHPDTWAIIPSRDPDRAAAVAATTGLPTVVVHTDPTTARDLPGVVNIVDAGPVNIHRWWRTGITTARARGARIAVILNDDVSIADLDQCRRLARHTLDTGATIGYVAARDTHPERRWNGRRLITGWAFALNLEHGLLPPLHLAWWYGDDWLDHHARTRHNGVAGVRVRIRHLKPAGGPRYPAEFAPLVEHDRAAWYAETGRRAPDHTRPSTTARTRRPATRTHMPIDPDAPPAVYVVRPGDTNPELRYSLRTLTNLPHSRVILVGYRPTWVTDVDHVPVRQSPPTPATKQGQVHRLLRALIDAAPTLGIAPDQRLTYLNDDEFILTPRTPTGIALHLGPIRAHAEQYAPRPARPGNPATATHGELLHATADHVGDLAPSWEAHTPLTIRLDYLEAVLDEVDTALDHGRARPLWRTLYGTAYLLADHTNQLGRDVKVDRRTPPDTWQHWDFLSTSDLSWRAHSATLHARYPDPSRYER